MERSNINAKGLSLTDIRQVLREEIKGAMSDLLGAKNDQTELVPRKQAIKELKISDPTYHRWVKLGIIPKPKRIGGKVFFTREQVEAIKSNLQSNLL